MKYVTYKGSIYSKANERIRQLRATNRPYSLTTEEEKLELENFLYWKVKATVEMLDTHETYTGVAMRRLEKDHPFGSYPLEWAETVATARAIGKMGIGIDYSYACLEELSELDRAEVNDREGDIPPVILAPEKPEKKPLKEKPEKVEKHLENFTTDDMKKSLEPPNAVTFEVLPPTETKPQPVTEQLQPATEQPVPLTQAEKVAARLEAKRLEREAKKQEKKRSKGKIVRVPIEPDIPSGQVQPPSKPDKYDNVLQSIESANPVDEVEDPIFGKAFPGETDPEDLQVEESYENDPDPPDELEIIEIN